jgi:hypothetical protein
MNDSQTAMSRQILLRLLVAVVLLAGVAILNSAYLYRLYFSDQLTVVGWIVNGAILLLFAIGLFRITTLLMRYAGEESALRKFIIQVEDGHQDVLKGINEKSLIARRYAAVNLLHERHASINHAALASAMLATESTRLSFPRFVHNVLILMGVLGTIISLSIALLGASNLMDVSQGIGGDMGLVIHGMSTAMSTTITAIICYLFYGYFYLKLTDVQTHLLGRVEQATTLYLMPQFAGSEEGIMAEVQGLVSSLHEVARQMEHAQSHYTEAGSQLRDIVSRLGSDMNALGQDVDEIKGLLREGFRLPARDDD